MIDSGSNWLRCDLHVHTPKSIVQGYGGDNDEVWEKYIQDLESLPSEFKVIGINDYLFLDGYEKVLQYKQQGRLNNIELLLPVVEYRLKIFSGHTQMNKINFHIVFADESELPLKDIKDNFLQRLVADKEFSPSTKWDKCIPNKAALEEFGSFCKDQIPNDKIGNQTNTEFGFSSLTYELPKIKELLNSPNFWKDGKKLYFTAIGRAEWEQMRWNSAMADKKGIINGVDFVFTGSPSVEIYEKGLANLKENYVNPKLLHFSDAHHFSGDDRETMRIGDSFTMIKCRPTFEGLRQIKHVFHERVKISDKPIEFKKPYYIIDNVRFNDNTGENLFQPDPIPLNQNLNTIIGGKSTGKSLLLNHIAKSIDRKEVERRDTLLTEYDHEKMPDFDFTVTWKDGETDTLNSGKNTERKIVYISQSYIDELTSNKFEERIKFNEFVLDILLQNENASKIFNDFQQSVIERLSLINTGIQRLFNIKNDINKKENDIAEIGDLLGVTNFIKALTDEIKELQDDGMTSEESTQYSELMDAVSSVRNAIDAFNKDQEVINNFKTTVITNIEEIKVEYDSALKILRSEEVSNDLQSIFTSPIQLSKTLNNQLSLMSDKVVQYMSKAVAELNVLDSQLAPLSNKSKQVTMLREKMAQLAEEQSKLVKIKSENIVLDTLKNKQKETLNDIVRNYEMIESLYLGCANNLKEFSDVSDELDINIQVRFNTSLFNSQIESNRANKPSLKRLFSNMTNADDAFEYKYDRKSHITNQEKFLKSIIDGSLRLNQYGNSKQLAKALFEDNYYLNFSISYQNDTLDAMSPGKKNLVVLKLLIELNNSEYPILIDQPEDDLDNRSIYDDLVQFILKKKGKRQMILVTHNPNVVVGTDSENTIVANQTGQANERTNRRYKFEYCNGPIEDSFNDSNADGILNQKGIKEHICDILEGGEKAFKERETRYSFK